MRAFLLAAIVFFVAGSARAATAVEQFQQIKLSPDKCKALEKELEPLSSKGHDWAKRPLRAEKVRWAIERLESLEYLEPKSAEVAVNALAENVNIAEPRFTALVKADCPMARFSLSRALINTYADKKTPASDRAEIRGALQKTLSRQKVPTVLAAALDMVVMSEAIEKKVFNVSDSRKKELREAQLKAKEFGQEITKKMWGPDPEKYSNINEEEGRKKMREHLAEEIREANKYLTQSMKWATEFTSTQR